MITLILSLFAYVVNICEVSNSLFSVSDVLKIDWELMSMELNSFLAMVVWMNRQHGSQVASLDGGTLLLGYQNPSSATNDNQDYSNHQEDQEQDKEATKGSRRQPKTRGLKRDAVCFFNHEAKSPTKFDSIDL